MINCIQHRPRWNSIAAGFAFQVETHLLLTTAYRCNRNAHSEKLQINPRPSWPMAGLQQSEWALSFKAGNMAEIIVGAMPKRGKKPVDHTGKRFGRLVVVSYYGRSVRKDKCGNAVWLCKCDCGKETTVIARSLIDGSTRSCGCLQRDNLIEMIKRNAGSNKKDWGEARFNDLFLSYQRHAKYIKVEFSLTKEQFRTITKGDCFYCGREPRQIVKAGNGVHGEYIYNGIDRIDSTKGYHLDNVRSCCKTCNIAKASMTEQEFYEWVDRIYTHLHCRYL